MKKMLPQLTRKKQKNLRMQAMPLSNQSDMKIYPIPLLEHLSGTTTWKNKEQLPPRASHSQQPTNRKCRIALYSHDTMGLGHKRRNLLITQTLGSSVLDTDILIISGMSDATNFSMPSGVDCLTLPALHKESDGQYRARRLDISLQEIITLRSQVIRTTLETFAPDILIVDNVPRGAMGELDLTLEYLRQRGETYCILGLRDILDEPSAVRRDWQRHHNEQIIRDYYDAVWVYGDPTVYNQTQEYRFAPETSAKLHYMGYLDQTARLKFVDGASQQALHTLNLPSKRLILCVVGGGQDGAQLAEAFVRAKFPSDAYGILLTGPFMPKKIHQRLQVELDKRADLCILEYFPEPTLLIERADRIIAMGGYNTTCEILSFQKPALIVPRIEPRKEQLVRAERLQAMGFLDVLHPTHLNASSLSKWLAKTDKLPTIRHPIDLNGLTRIPQFLEEILAVPRVHQSI
jgi:predicted glycosyltransferase